MVSPDFGKSIAQPDRDWLRQDFWWDFDQDPLQELVIFNPENLHSPMWADLNQIFEVPWDSYHGMSLKTKMSGLVREILSGTEREFSNGIVKPASETVHVICVTGGVAVGKSSLIHELARLFAEEWLEKTGEPLESHRVRYINHYHHGGIVLHMAGWETPKGQVPDDPHTNDLRNFGLELAVKKAIESGANIIFVEVPTTALSPTKDLRTAVQTSYVTTYPKLLPGNEGHRIVGSPTVYNIVKYTGEFEGMRGEYVPFLLQIVGGMGTYHSLEYRTALAAASPEEAREVALEYGREFSEGEYHSAQGSGSYASYVNLLEEAEEAAHTLFERARANDTQVDNNIKQTVFDAFRRIRNFGSGKYNFPTEVQKVFEVANNTREHLQSKRVPVIGNLNKFVRLFTRIVLVRYINEKINTSFIYDIDARFWGIFFNDPQMRVEIDEEGYKRVYYVYLDY